MRINLNFLGKYFYQGKHNNRGGRCISPYPSLEHRHAMNHACVPTVLRLSTNGRLSIYVLYIYIPLGIYRPRYLRNLCYGTMWPLPKEITRTPACHFHELTMDQPYCNSILHRNDSRGGFCILLQQPVNNSLHSDSKPTHRPSGGSQFMNGCNDAPFPSLRVHYRQIRTRWLEEISC